ncbi:transcription initiation factor TFIID subunit 5-like [Humulus lupulus]|uniref:transcription initiation factor TFIID subunit 5-like n=1 Tax=Humulus lupulus TaxID=3486 RepID=UPI002B415392|nr:transcription initiation factor TFIID subunit 5-like [Humulus lupulus]
MGDFILSSSADSTIRLWSTELNANLVCYKGHNYPVWDVQYSPVGHYFASASHDQTARIWSMERIQPLRIMAGHLSDVDVSFSLTLLRVIKGN